MRKTLNSFLDDFVRRGEETVFSHRPDLRTLRWSGKEIAETACRFARELEGRGVKKGERVLVCARNSPEWIAAFFGCLLRGVIVVPLDLQSSVDFISRVRQQTGPRLLLYSKGAAVCPDPSLPRIDLEELPQLVAPHSSEPYRGQ